MISNILTGLAWMGIILLILVGLVILAQYFPTTVGFVLVGGFFLSMAAWLGDAINNGP